MEHTQTSLLLVSVVIAAPLSWPVNTKTIQPVLSSVDVYFGGNGRIVGTVKEKGSPANTPVWRRVRLIYERTGRLIRETWSDPVTGAYAFDWIKPGEIYTVLALDHTGHYRAVVADNLTPEAMP